ncbi:MAG: hypothetical protein LC789_05935 [Actinobacteria bacterium]|nr:hypothetical protein [Actinomycetota bacterium]MCA1719941.1 hypothetical protein [Actinomycetota bacterium]
MTIRTAVVLSLAATVVAGGAAVAAPKAAPSCNLVTDAKGDGTGFLLTDMNYLPNDRNLDLVSGDVAATAKTITAVIRTDALDLKDSDAPTGRAYYANFTVDGVELFLSAALDGAGGATYSGGYIEGRRTRLGEATGVLDTKAQEIRISAPVSLFAEKAPIKPGKKVLDLNLLAQRYVGDRSAGGVTPSADEATGGKAYVVGAPSCAKVGA